MILRSFTKSIFILLLLLYPLYAEKPQNIILEATGKADSETKAINKGLDILSQQIYVSVTNKSVSTEKLDNNFFSTSVESNSVLYSNGYFQNISIYNKKNSKKNGFEVTVGLTKESISSTIDYLFVQLKENEVYILSKSQLKEQLNMSNFLFSLLSYAKANNIAYNKQSLDLKEYISKLNKILSADAVVKFVVYPNNTNVSIAIEKTTYRPYKNIYLGKGKYFYEITATGYKTIQDSIDLYKGDDTEIDIYLQKQLDAPVPVKIKLINETNIANNVLLAKLRSLVSKNQMQEKSNSSNYIEFQLSEKTSASVISGYNNNIVNVIIKSYINGVEKIETFSVNNLSKDNKQENFQNNIINQIFAKSQIFFARLFD